jgi:hypothetical protein
VASPRRHTVRVLVASCGTVYAMSLALIASVYVGFAVADGRTRVVAVEATAAAAFVFLAASQ